VTRAPVPVAVVAALVVLAAAPAGRARLILISVDGLVPERYTSVTGSPLLRDLAARGAFASGVVGVWPTNTRPTHTSLLTGVTPAMHGIVNNEPLDPERRRNPAFNWFAREIRVPTLVTAAEDAGLSTAVVGWPVSVGMHADWLLPTFNWTHPRDAHLLRTLSTPGVFDDYERQAGEPFGWPPTDERRVNMALLLLQAHRPDVTLLYLGEFDAYAHTYGLDGDWTASAAREVDRQLRRVLQVIDAQADPRTFVAIVSDHGFIDVEHAVGPNTLFAREGLIELDEDGGIRSWQAFSHGTGGSSLVYLGEPTDEATAGRAGDLLETFARDERSGIERILAREDLAREGADPAATFALAMRPGYSLIEDTNRLFGNPYIAAMHGYPPERPEMRASFILTGPGLEGTGNLGVVRMTQIGPTLAKLLGITLSPEADNPIPLASR